MGLLHALNFCGLRNLDLMSPASAKNLAHRLQQLSSRLSWILSALIAAQLALSALLLSSPTRGDSSWIVTLLGTSWILWIVALTCNLFLVRCGPIDLRYRYAPGLVNRPDFAVRVVLHLLINWSTLGLTIAVAWIVAGDALSRRLAWLTLAMSIFVWAGFNIQHRRVNRGRNWLISTAIMVTLVISSAWLLFM